MPAVELRARDQRAELAEPPRYVRMQEHGVEREERHVRRDRDRAEAEHDERRRLDPARQPIVDGMQPHGRQPIEVLGAVVDRVELPERAAVKPAMCPVADEVAEHEHLDSLETERLPREQRIARRQELTDLGEILPVDQHEDHGKADLRDRLRHERRGKPIPEIRLETAAPIHARLIRIGREQRLDEPEERRQHEQADE